MYLPAGASFIWALLFLPIQLSCMPTAPSVSAGTMPAAMFFQASWPVWCRRGNRGPIRSWIISGRRYPWLLFSVFRYLGCGRAMYCFLDTGCCFSSVLLKFYFLYAAPVAMRIAPCVHYLNSRHIQIAFDTFQLHNDTNKHLTFCLLNKYKLHSKYKTARY